jgi:transcriptional regulator with XRE-family HTH domain
MNLLDEAKQLLACRRIQEVANQTGFSYQWIWQIAKGKNNNPGIVRLEKLVKHLKKTNVIPS